MTTNPDRLAVFRCDASARIGGGHVRRCWSLATALIEDGWRVAFATNPGAEALVPQLADARLQNIVLSCPAEDEAAVLRDRFPEGCGLIVVDHYGRDAAFEGACRGWAARILAVDDLANRRHDCDFLLDQTGGVAPEVYRGLTPPECRLLLGPDYALLDPRFARRRWSSGRLAGEGPFTRLLLGFGAADARNVTGRIIGMLAESALAGQFAIDVVLGPGAPHLAAVQAGLADRGSNGRLHVGVDDMAALMHRTQGAIGAPGGTAWERCCLGLPSLMATVADNQRRVAATLHDAGAAVSLGPVESLSRAALEEALARLVEDAGYRQALGRRAALACDGLGVRRAAMAAGQPELTKRGATVALRPARPEDCEAMLEWQSAPGARTHFRNPAPPTRARHEAWFAERMADPFCLLSVILENAEPAGVLRLDRLDPAADEPETPRFEVSILVAAGRAGAGVGAAALRCARRLAHDATLLAEIDPRNAASLRAFTKAGFEPGPTRRQDTCNVRARPAGNRRTDWRLERPR